MRVRISLPHVRFSGLFPEIPCSPVQSMALQVMQAQTLKFLTILTFNLSVL